MVIDKIRVAFNRLSSRYVAVLMVLVGVATFFNGLTNPFQGDDTYQIVNNPPVHSIGNLFQFFGASTFYNGETLSGVYYRPLMSTMYSLIYTLFGAHTFMFHAVQLAVYIGGAFLLYLVLKHFIPPALSLLLALVFLVHPINSQIVYSIPTLQDALFFFFGMLALWLLIHYKSVNSLWAVAGCLLLALFSKEAGWLFVIMAVLYVWWFNRPRLKPFIGILVLPLALYVLLKVNAVGWHHSQHAGPIDSASLASRLLTAPSILLFYIKTLVLPLSLASTHYWVYATFSVAHVLVPLLTVLAVIVLFAYGGYRVRSKLPKRAYKTYLFFAIWAVLGLVPYLQIIPLDMTVCETWFYFATAGLFGMIGLSARTFSRRKMPAWSVVFLLIALCVVIIGFGVRSGLRGGDYRSQYVLAQHDVAVEPSNYSALSNISQHLIDTKKYNEAAAYAQRSIDVYPVMTNYNNLGVARQQAGNYPAAIQAYKQALKYNDLNIIYENLSLILIVHSSPTEASQFLQKAVIKYPHDFKLWVYLAIFEGARGNHAGAKAAISNASQYGQVPPYISTNIMNSQPFTLPLLGKSLLIH